MNISDKSKILSYLESRRGQWCCTVDIEKATNTTAGSISHILCAIPQIERMTIRPTDYPYRGGTSYRWMEEKE